MYCHANPVNGIDPTGLLGVFTQAFGFEVEVEIENLYARDSKFAGNNVTFGKWARLPGLLRAKPDILDHDRKKYMEIKPLSPSGVAAAIAQMAMRYGQFYSKGYSPDKSWHMLPKMIYPLGIPTIFFNVEGVLFSLILLTWQKISS